MSISLTGASQRLPRHQHVFGLDQRCTFELGAVCCRALDVGASEAHYTGRGGWRLEESPLSPPNITGVTSLRSEKAYRQLPLSRQNAMTEGALIRAHGADEAFE
jgi:hypothetical protein